MKIAAVSMVKNECDIIELFIKINTRFFDAIYILDHCSTDSTSDIVKLMKKKGFNIFYTLLSDKVYNQATITTNAVRQISRLGIYDFIMPIDADEFIPDNKIEFIKKFLIEKKSDFEIGYFPWKTYCPISNDYFKTQAPLYNNFKPRKSEPNQFYKIIISNKIATNCEISMGNHDLINESKFNHLKKYVMPSHLIHTPVRSEEQIISKAILGSHSFKLKKDRKPGEGFHWDEITQKIRTMNYSIPNELLSKIASNYAVPQKNCNYDISDANMIESQSTGIGQRKDIIEFLDLAKINIIKNFDNYISQLITNNIY
jgi:hypothetical protein